MISFNSVKGKSIILGANTASIGQPVTSNGNPYLTLFLQGIPEKEVVNINSMLFGFQGEIYDMNQNISFIEKMQNYYKLFYSLESNKQHTKEDDYTEVYSNYFHFYNFNSRKQISTTVKIIRHDPNYSGLQPAKDTISISLSVPEGASMFSTYVNTTTHSTWFAYVYSLRLYNIS